MAKQTFTTGQVLTAAQVNSLQTNDFNQTVSAKTASYVLVAADKGTRIEFNTSGSVTCTVNTGLFDAGDTLIVQNRGAGAVTITAGTATVNTSGSLVVNQYESGTLYFISASAALWFGSNPGDITGITTGATSGLTGGVTSGTADLKLNTTAKGALLVGTGSGTVTELTVGSNNTVLTADSTTASGLKWAATAAPSFNTGYAYNATLEGTTSASYTDLASVVSTTVTTGTKALVSISATSMNNSAIAGMLVGFAISGATTVSASDEYSTGGIYYFDTSTKLESKTGATFVVTGLTAGSNTFTMKFKRKDGTGTVNFNQKSISVVNLGS